MVRFFSNTTYESAARRPADAALAPPRMHHTVITTTSRCAPHGTAAPVRRARTDSSGSSAHMLLPPPFEDAVHARIWEVLQGSGSARTHTGDELSRAWGTTEGFVWEFGNEGGCASQAPQALVVNPPVAVLANAFLASTKWAAAIGASSAVARPRECT